MTLTLTPLKWDTPLNPQDEVEYTFDLTGRLLETGEDIQSWVFTLSADAIAAGLLEGSGQYATEIGILVNGIFQADPSGTILRIWFSIDVAHQSDVGFSGAGTWFPMTIHVVTTNSPPRIRQRTLLLRVCQQ